MKHLVVVGVGALGSHFVLMARNLEATFVLVDFDRVEKKNVLSQFHTKMGTGRNKTQALQQAMQGLFGIWVETRPAKLVEGNLEALLGEADLVVDCVDNAATRKLIQDYCVEHDIPCLHGALSAEGEFGQVTWTEHFEVDSEDVEGQATCEDGEQLPFISYAASILAKTAQHWLKTGEKRSYFLLAEKITRVA